MDNINPDHYKGAGGLEPDGFSRRDLQQAADFIELAQKDLSTQMAREYVSNAIWWLKKALGQKALLQSEQAETLADGIDSGRE